MIFISAGHHKDKPGASFDAFNEYDEALRWKDLICEHLGDEKCMPVPDGVLQDKVNYINQRDPSRSIAMEIHFNSARDKHGNPVGRGCETLYYPGSTKGVRLAQAVNDTLAEDFEPNRGIKEGYYRMDPRNGADFFLEKTHCPAIIIEPDFVHRKEIIQSKRNMMCRSLAATLVRIQLEIYP